MPFEADENEPATPAGRARGGIRAWVREAGRRDGTGLWNATPYGIVAFLAASAVAPIAGVAPGASGEFAAALGQLGGVGSDYLSDSLYATARRMRGDNPSNEQWRDALAGSGDWVAGLWHLDPDDVVRRLCAIAVPNARDGDEIPELCR
jgi:hypothetical protein